MKLFSKLLLSLTLIASSVISASCDDCSDFSLASCSTNCSISCDTGCSTSCEITNPYAQAFQHLLNELLPGGNFSSSYLLNMNHASSNYRPEYVIEHWQKFYETSKSLIIAGNSVDDDMGFGCGSFREIINDSVIIIDAIKALELSTLSESRSATAYVQVYVSVFLKKLQALIEKHQPEVKA